MGAPAAVPREGNAPAGGDAGRRPAERRAVRGTPGAARGTARHPPNYPPNVPIRSLSRTEPHGSGKNPGKVVGAQPGQNSYLCRRLPGPAWGGDAAWIH